MCGESGCSRGSCMVHAGTVQYSTRNFLTFVKTTGSAYARGC